MKISQSFLKDYHRGDCGGQLSAKYVTQTWPDKQPEQGSPAHIGVYFEYLITGYVRAGHPIPEPEIYQKSGAGYKAGDVKPSYIMAAKQAHLFVVALNEAGMIATNFGKTITAGPLVGTYDVFTNKGLIDLKMSSLLYDRWHEYGWGVEKFEYATKAVDELELLEVLKRVPLLWQPLHYCHIMHLNTGVYPDWYWYIASDKSDDVIFRKLEVSQRIRDSYAVLIDQISSEVDIILNTGGFEYKPSWNNCNKCEIAAKCDKCVKVPTIETINL